MSDPAAITGVSDTALWVATFRAEESNRSDAAFRDPLASRLAGQRGRKIARHMAYRELMRWIMVMRTVGIDQLLEAALADDVDTVVNLGAGLDTRPYRLPLPADLRWVEVDFPQIVDLKNHALHGETPRCRLERRAVDLTREEARRALLADLGGSSRRILVITEGVIPYLTNDEAGALSDDLRATPSVWGWIQDFNNTLSAARRRGPRGWNRKMRAAPFRFEASPDWFSFFTARGWHVRSSMTALDVSRQLRRPLPGMGVGGLILRFMPELREKIFRDISGAVLFTKG